MNEQEQMFLKLVEEHKHIIYKVCFMYASEKETINDLYQEVMLNLWKGFPRFRGDSKPTTWVYRIAVNTCVSWLRSSARQPQTVPLKSTAGLFCAQKTATRADKGRDEGK